MREREEESNEKARLEEFRKEKMKILEIGDMKVEEEPISEEQALLNEPDMFRKPSRTRARENCGSKLQGTGDDYGILEQGVGSEGVQDDSSLRKENLYLCESLGEDQKMTIPQEEYQDERSHHGGDKSVQDYDQSGNQPRFLSGEEKVTSTEGPTGRPSWPKRIKSMPRIFQKNGKVKKKINQGPIMAWWLTRSIYFVYGAGRDTHSHT